MNGKSSVIFRNSNRVQQVKKMESPNKSGSFESLKSNESENEVFRGFDRSDKINAENIQHNILGCGPVCNCCGDLKTSKSSNFVCQVCVLGFKTVDEMTSHLLKHHSARKNESALQGKFFLCKSKQCNTVKKNSFF